MGLSTATFILEICILFAVFCLINIIALRKGPRAFVHHYPDEVQSHAILLAKVTRGFIITKTKIWMPLSWLIYSVVVILMLVIGNDSTVFFTLFTDALIFFQFINWIGFILIECIILLHVKSLVIKGTEEMLKSYGVSYFFKKRIVYTLILIPYSAVIAGIAMLFI